MSDPDSTDFRFLAENSVDIISRVGADRIVRYVSPACLEVLGWRPEEMIGAPLDRFVLAEDLLQLAAALNRDASRELRAANSLFRMRRKDGPAVWMENRSRAVLDSATGQVTEFVILMRDISERKRFEEELLALALTDSLTGLSNRRAFDEALEREWKRALREGSYLSLLLFDVDHFKEFNDQRGHQAGDECLRAIATAVSGAMRAADTTARYGGEEMAIILPSTDAAGAAEAAERVRSIIEGLRINVGPNGDRDGWISASVGAATAIARRGGAVRMPEGLLLAADGALYRAKRQGRNRVATTLVYSAKSG